MNKDLRTSSSLRLFQLPSGKLTVCDMENGPVELVDFPRYKMVDLSMFFPRLPGEGC